MARNSCKITLDHGIYVALQIVAVEKGTTVDAIANDLLQGAAAAARKSLLDKVDQKIREEEARYQAIEDRLRDRYSRPAEAKK